jgi:AcrR family transcriptional regulator
VVDHRIRSRKEKFASNRQPVQERSRQRREEILKTTAALLERAGFDDLTTILIAHELKISVGSLYHYFPNKQAILYALGEQWLEEHTRTLEDIKSEPLEELDIPAFVDLALGRLLQVYREQKGVLPLVHAMWAVPELRDLDERHDEVVISYLTDMYRRIGLDHKKSERERRGQLMLEMTHALFLSIIEQSPAKAGRSYEDLKRFCTTLLEQN